MPQDLHGFFYPRTVALIGATDKRDKPGTAILENLAHFHGGLPREPKHETLLVPLLSLHHGRSRGYRPAIIALPAALVERGSMSTQGHQTDHPHQLRFCEAGEAGIMMQKRIAERRKIRHTVIGPNASGL
jgi:hypothetical protein